MKRLKFLALVLAGLMIFAGGAFADVVYTTVDAGYTSGSIGAVAGGEISPGGSSNLPNDTKVFSFTDHSGRERVLFRENTDASADSVTIYSTPGNWDRSDVEVNGNWFGKNIYGVETFGDYLYLVTNQTDNWPEQGSGQVIRVDMRNGYKFVDSYDLKNLVEDDKGEWRCGGVAIKEFGGDIYVVTAVFNLSLSRQFKASEVIKFGNGLLQEPVVSVPVGKNAVGLTGGAAFYKGKLYIGCLGSAMGQPQVDGGYWEVDLAGMTSRQIINLDEYDALGLDGPYSGSGIAIAEDDGAAFLMLLDDSDYDNPKARLYVTDVDQIVGGSIGTEVSDFPGKTGGSWGVSYDEYTKTFWCMAGEELQAWRKDGSFIRSFTPADLGDNISYVAVVEDASGDGSDSSGDGSGSGSSGGGGGCDSGLLGGFGGLGLLALLALYAGPASRASSKCRRG
ncbi:MAG: hypothetical protein LBL73_08745 [Synergistaceae bacterium]|jgi:hypothetical protein|nr:hypothetical protein [Synergistaceae bacterium]